MDLFPQADHTFENKMTKNNEVIIIISSDQCRLMVPEYHKGILRVAVLAVFAV